MEVISGGEYFQVGIEISIRDNIGKWNISSNVKLLLQINADGIPLHKSTSSQFWPILFRAAHPFKSEVLVAGLFHDKKKKQVTLIFRTSF